LKFVFKWQAAINAYKMVKTQIVKLFWPPNVKTNFEFFSLSKLIVIVKTMKRN
jgi:hypothetical protein